MYSPRMRKYTYACSFVVTKPNMSCKRSLETEENSIKMEFSSLR